MSRLSLEDMAVGGSRQTADIVRDILRDVKNLPRLMEVYYLMQEPGLLEIMRGIGALPDRDRKRLQVYMLRQRHKPLRVRELPTGAVVLEFGDEARLEESA